ncbi:MFS transporter [Actinotalea ferrariae]|uniref:MFS transporter n=1 Tax=Actinotalea ferrariae TaxID=1386098 RepID=UPI001C8CE16A|nr:MFS transporter [Actinotalea ferrariae]MBX9245875.1 MFS transporter [Actinotalea ferrariae]
MTRRRGIGYALGSVGTGGFGTLPGLVLAYYLTDELGVAAGLASLVVTVPKVWDVVVDPFIGARSDARYARTATRRPFLLAGALGLPLAFVALFAVPAALTGAAAALWVTLAFVVATTAFSLFQVPYIALPAEMATTYAARTRLVAPRIAVLAVAILVFGAGGPLLRDAAGGGRTGYLVMAAGSAVLIGLGLLAAWSDAPRAHDGAAPGPSADPPARRSVRRGDALTRGVGALREVPALRALLATFVLQALAIGAMLAGAQYVATYVLGSESAVAVLFAALVAPAVLVMPLARRLADRIGKHRAYRAATLLFAAAALALVPMLWAPGVWVYVPVACAGVAYAGLQVYPLAMLPDVAATDARDRGTDRAGVLSGVWTAGETAGLALGPTLLLLVLAVTGFVSRQGGAVAEQPASAIAGVVLSFSLLPAVLVAASLTTLRAYPLTRATVDATAVPEEV